LQKPAALLAPICGERRVVSAFLRSSGATAATKRERQAGRKAPRGTWCGKIQVCSPRRTLSHMLSVCLPTTRTHTHTHTRTYTIVSETERGWEGLKIKCMCRRQRVAMRHSACLHMYCAARRGAHVVRQRHMAPSALQWGLKPSAAQRVYRGLQWGLQGAYNEVYSPQRRAHGVYTPRAFHHMPQASG